jgi:hypothetical protein
MGDTLLGMDLVRQKVSAEALQHILIATFDRIKPPACTECSVPLPQPLPAATEHGTNWWLGILTGCAHGCASSIGWLWYQFGPRYELIQEQEDAV